MRPHHHHSTSQGRNAEPLIRQRLQIGVQKSRMTSKNYTKQSRLQCDHPPILSQPPLPNPWAWLVLVLWSNQFASGQGFFFRWVLDVVSVQTPCYQKLRHSIYPDFHLIFWLCLACRAWYVIWTDPCWWYFHHSDVVVGCLCKVSRGASGACVRRAERVGSPRPVFWHKDPVQSDLEVPVSKKRSLVIPTNKIYSTTVAMKTWKTALFSCDSCQWAITTKTAQHRGGLIYDSSNLVPEIHWNNRRFKCSHALNHGCIDTYCTNLHIFAYSQGSNTTQYEFCSNQTWCPQLALSHCPGRDHKAKVTPQW